MDTQITVLKKLAEEFNNEYIPATFRGKSEKNGIPMDMVSLLYTEYGTGDGEAAVDLFFLPVSNQAADMQYYGVVINIAEDIPAELKSGLSYAVSVLNFLTPFGTYIMSPDGSTVFYKLVTPMRADMTEEELLAETDLLTANALDVAENNVSLIQKLIKGQLTEKDFEGLLP